MTHANCKEHAFYLFLVLTENFFFASKKCSPNEKLYKTKCANSQAIIISLQKIVKSEQTPEPKMVKVKPTIFFVMILAKICCLLAAPAGDDKKDGSQEASKVTAAVPPPKSGSGLPEIEKQVEDQKMKNVDTKKKIIPSIIKSLLKNTALIKKGFDAAMNSPLMPVYVKVVVAIGKM